MKTARMTSNEVLELDEIFASRRATDTALRIHINHANNVFADLERREKEWMKRAVAAHGMNPDCEHRVDLSGFAATLVEIPPKEIDPEDTDGQPETTTPVSPDEEA